jgi:hypothetical protein
LEDDVEGKELVKPDRKRARSAGITPLTYNKNPITIKETIPRVIDAMSKPVCDAS